MKKYWKIIITLCVITLTGMRLYEYFRDLKEQFTDVVGEPIEYDEEKADPVYSGSYTFDGKEIQFFLDNYYGLPESYVIKDGKEINIYSNRSDWKSKDQTKILHIQTTNVDNYDVYIDGKLYEPTIIENKNAKLKIYEFDSDAKVVAVPVGKQTFDEYTVIQCKENQTCKYEMKIDLNELKQYLDSWERIKRVDELPHYTIMKSMFDIRAEFYEYEYLHGFNQKVYKISGGLDENEVGYIDVWGPTKSNISPAWRLTKKQFEEFEQYLDSIELVDITKE